MNSLKKLLDLLTASERKRAVLLLVMILVMALMDTIGVASIMPFIAVLANPDLVETNAVLAFIYERLNFNDQQSFLFGLGVVVFVLLVLSLIFKAITTYVQLRFTLVTEYSLSKRLVEGYLHQPYSWFLNHHSAELGKTVLSEVGDVITYGMMPLMVFIAQSFVAIALLTLLMIVDPMVSIVAGSVLGVVYGLIYILISGFLSRIGSERVQANKERFIVLNEAFGAAKEVKVGGLEQVYISRFSVPAKTYAVHQASAQVIAQLPRFVLEMIAFGGMLLLVLILMSRSGSFTNAIPIIALYAFAGYRLMPALQQIYGSFSQLRFSSPSLDLVHTELMSLHSEEVIPSETDTMQFTQAIDLKDVSFTYPKAATAALHGVNLSIPADSTVGFVGATGGGKTTTIDIILGLLEPQQGELYVDGNLITADNRRQWQKVLGYVPQQIYLADDSIAANIAFGVEPTKIDQDALERAAKIANLHDFVMNEMPQKYATHIGERGVRISGGQRQRIGIARALYHNPRVLVLDEATSALDNLTEQAVMDAVNNLSHEITIILIAHRLSTVRHCDQIYLLEKGRIKAEGTYDALIQKSETFRAMASK